MSVQEHISPPLTDRQREVLAAIARKPHVNVAYVRLVVDEDAWATVHETITGLVSAGLARWLFAGTRVQVTDAGRVVLGLPAAAVVTAETAARFAL